MPSTACSCFCSFGFAFTENAGVAFAVEFIFAFGWIPSLAGAAAGVVFSLLSLKERHGKLFLICSCVNVAIGIAWGIWGIRAMMPYEPIY